MSAVTMVTGHLTVPCDSLSTLYSHVQVCIVMPNVVVFLRCTVIAMQQNTLSQCFTSAYLNQSFTLTQVCTTVRSVYTILLGSILHYGVFMYFKKNNLLFYVFVQCPSSWSVMFDAVISEVIKRLCL